MYRFWEVSCARGHNATLYKNFGTTSIVCLCGGISHESVASSVLLQLKCTTTQFACFAGQCLFQSSNPFTLMFFILNKAISMGASRSIANVIKNMDSPVHPQVIANRELRASSEGMIPVVFSTTE